MIIKIKFDSYDKYQRKIEEILCKIKKELTNSKHI